MVKVHVGLHVQCIRKFCACDIHVYTCVRTLEEREVVTCTEVTRIHNSCVIKKIS